MSESTESTSLHYQRRGAFKPPRPSPARWVLATMGVLVLSLFVPFGSWLNVEDRTDPVTGSSYRMKTWLGMLGEAPVVTASPIETSLRQRGIPYTAGWQFVHRTERNVFGRARGFECGTAPAMYHFPHSLQTPYVATATDDELRAFVAVMQSGTDEEQRAAVDAACDRALEALTAPHKANPE